MLKTQLRVSADTNGDHMEMGSPTDNVKRFGGPAAQPDAIDDDGRPKRTGNLWNASAHVITAVIGSGVLSLAWSMAQLGWVAGPPVLLAFAFVTYYTSLLLADCYRSPDPVTGRRNYTYMDAVKANLGGTKVWICGAVQYGNLVGTAIGYTITASISMVAIKRSNCFHVHGEQALCRTSSNIYMTIFGATQLLLSQIPDFSKISWLSVAAAVMSFSYSLIGLGLGIAKTFERGHSHGTLTGKSLSTLGLLNKLWHVFQSLGNIAFAYSFSMILIEIQDTLKATPAENSVMKKATLLGIFTTTVFYMSVGCFGYAAFGDTAPGNLLTGFGFYNPFWLVDVANACIVIHLVGAYQNTSSANFNMQVYSQPLFAFVEDWVSSTWPRSKFFKKEYTVGIPFRGYLLISPFRIIWRSVFVISTTAIAMLLPFFNDVLGLMGAFAFWPLTVYFPIEMHIAQSKTAPWTSKWCHLKLLSMICLLVSVAAAVGSVAGLKLASVRAHGSSSTMET
ncbi:hypothetical protein O6H91_06G126600 [Diphasiastrum complanatum]|uniref:Uncharacterized protein n=1 Tax=Diphasiastrum complanatum TaxID=34168 RepID=A0ACC2DIP8_DIPCM|nr:hypothetical protein O6H91_06G126600 [Diphasiastrum complanatum]